MERAFPALDISSESFYTKDKLRVSFLGDILVKCNKASSLVLDYYPLNQFLGLINPILKSITFIKAYRNEYRVSYFTSTEIAMWARNNPLHQLSVILKHYKKSMNDPIVHLHLQAPSSLQYSLKKPTFQNVKTLCLSQVTRSCKKTDTFKLIAFCPNLTHLSLKDITNKTVMERMIYQLSGNNFQSLKHLSLVSSKRIQGNLSVLFASVWPHLEYLSLLETPLSETDLEFLCLTCNGPNKKLPNLTSLCVTIQYATLPEIETSFTKLFMLPWLNLTKLFVDSHGLSNAMEHQKLSNLTCLRIRTTNITHRATETLCLDQFTNLQSVFLDNCQFPTALNRQILSELGISFGHCLTGNLSSLTDLIFPKLNVLTLRKCGLTALDLKRLAQA